MQQTIQSQVRPEGIHRDRSAPTLIVGLLLIAAGIAVLVLRQAGVDLPRLVGETGWPLFVIGPGVILLVASTIPTPPRGIGFAIAGSIVTTVGLLLWYQAQTGDWESWAYLWAAVPLAIGLAFLAYGGLIRDGRMVTAGLWIGGTATLALGIGAWFFQGVFSGQPSIWSGTWWAVIAIVAGVAITIRSLIRRRG